MHGLANTMKNEVQLIRDNLIQLRVNSFTACNINNDAMAYETLVVDNPINQTIQTSTKYDAAYWYQKNGNFTNVEQHNQMGQAT